MTTNRSRLMESQTLPPSDYVPDDVLSTYRLDGSMLKMKARVLMEAWLDNIYPRIKSTDTSTSSLLAIGESLMSLGDLKPKPQAGPVGGQDKFSISIVLPAPPGVAPTIIEGTMTSPEPTPPSRDMSDRPSYLKVLDNPNDELMVDDA